MLLKVSTEIGVGRAVLNEDMLKALAKYERHGESVQVLIAKETSIPFVWRGSFTTHICLRTN